MWDSEGKRKGKNVVSTHSRTKGRAMWGIREGIKVSWQYTESSRYHEG